MDRARVLHVLTMRRAPGRGILTVAPGMVMACTVLMLATAPAKAETKPRTVQGLVECKAADPVCATAAGAFSPMVWLAPDELAYPMLPHPFAFDGIDNDDDGCLDLDDPDEVTALVPKDKSNEKTMRSELVLLLKRLKKYNLLLAMDPVPKGELEAAPVDVPTGDCSKTKRLSEFRLCREVGAEIKCGPTPAVLYHFQRGVEGRAGNTKSGLPTPLRRKIDALQYWMYYPWDDGHLHDGEHVTVFVPQAGERRGSPVEAMIGAGHVPSTGNNVLVSTDWEPVPQRPGGPQLVGPHTPSNIRPHLPVLVEMGKHASAPDLNCNGRFDIGLDANFLPTGAWGTRDINFALDKTQWGDTKDWFSLQRARSGLLTERTFNGGNEDVRKPYIDACPAESFGRQLLLNAPPRSGPALEGYRLVDANILRDLTEAASRQGPEAEAQVKALLFDHQNLLFGDSKRWDSLDKVSYSREALAQWGKDNEISSAPRPDIWNHTDFGTYVNDFKLSIFPRISLGPIFSASNGNGRWGLFLRLSDLRILNMRLAADSSLEFRLLFDRLRLPGSDNATSVSGFNDNLLGRDSKAVPQLGFVYNAFSTGYRGPYVGLTYQDTYVSYRREFLYPEGRLADPDAKDYVVVERQSRNLYVEAGYSAALPGLLEQALRWGRLKRFAQTHPLQFRFGLAGPLIKGGRRLDSGDPGVLRAYNVPSSVELRVSVQLVAQSLLGRRHPLGFQN